MRALDTDDAEAAAPERREAIIVTERGHIEANRTHGLQDGEAIRRLDVAAVNGQSRHD
jgi:hypothetical protein